MIATSPSRSDGLRRSVVVGNPACRRVELFQAALRRAGWPPASLVCWTDLIAGQADLREVVRAGDCVRIESPGRHWPTERALLLAGASEADEFAAHARLSAPAVRSLAFDKGRIHHPRQWYLGFRAVLQRLERQLAERPGCAAMSCSEDIALMFDKPRCHERLRERGVDVPEGFGPVQGWDDFQAQMARRGWRRAFLKPAHGSSASGVIAYRTNGDHIEATTSVEMIREGGDLRLYNSRALRPYRDIGEIAALVDELARHRLWVERWLPKAGLAGRAFDLRVVVIRGIARHRVVRTSRTPITNLHLLNERGDADAARQRVGDTAWNAALSASEQAAACFPRSLHAGVDVLITSDYRRAAVLEVNAFGDLLPNLLHGVQDTYDAEIEAMGTAPVALGLAA